MRRDKKRRRGKGEKGWGKGRRRVRGGDEREREREKEKVVPVEVVFIHSEGIKGFFVRVWFYFYPFIFIGGGEGYVRKNKEGEKK